MTKTAAEWAKIQEQEREYQERIRHAAFDGIRQAEEGRANQGWVDAVRSVFGAKPAAPAWMNPPGKSFEVYIDQALASSRGDAAQAVSLLIETWKDEPDVAKGRDAFLRALLTEYISQRVKAQAKAKR